MSRPAGLCLPHPGVDGRGLGGRGWAHLRLRVPGLGGIAPVPVGRVLVVRVSVAVHVGIASTGALAKPSLVVGGHPRPGLSSSSSSSSSRWSHHVGHEVAGRQQGGDGGLTALLCLITSSHLARGELSDILSHLSVEWWRREEEKYCSLK